MVESTEEASDGGQERERGSYRIGEQQNARRREGGRGELRQGGMNLKEEGVPLWMESRWEREMVDGKQMGGRNEG